jgi:hypothetical protein
VVLEAEQEPQLVAVVLAADSTRLHLGIVVEADSLYQEEEEHSMDCRREEVDTWELLLLVQEIVVGVVRKAAKLLLLYDRGRRKTRPVQEHLLGRHYCYSVHRRHVLFHRHSVHIEIVVVVAVMTVGAVVVAVVVVETWFREWISVFRLFNLKSY